MKRFARSLLPALVALSILLAACGGGAGSGGSSGSITHPAGDDLVLRVDYRGGMIANGFVTSFPTFSLQGDGRVIVPGAQIDIFPGPALPAVNVRRLTEEGIQAVLDLVASTGLFHANAVYRGAQNFVADGTETVFTLHADSQEVQLVVYALGLLDPAGNNPGISADELAVHRVLSQLLERLGTLDAWVPISGWADAAWGSYQPDALRLIVRNADADPSDDNGIGNALLDWPDDSDPAAFGDVIGNSEERCGVVSGDGAEAWYSALSGANQLTRFVKGEHRYQVTVRFQLPDEPMECPSPDA
jgi:hypothetical protein